MERKIALVKAIGFGLAFVYSLLPLVAGNLYVTLAPFAPVIVAIYVLLVIVCFWLQAHEKQLDHSLLWSSGIFLGATVLAYFWPTALGYTIYLGMTAIAYGIPTYSGFKRLAKI